MFDLIRARLGPWDVLRRASDRLFVVGDLIDAKRVPFETADANWVRRDHEPVIAGIPRGHAFHSSRTAEARRRGGLIFDLRLSIYLSASIHSRFANATIDVVVNRRSRIFK
jgi:hypothetical protein